VQASLTQIAPNKRNHILFAGIHERMAAFLSTALAYAAKWALLDYPASQGGLTNHIKAMGAQAELEHVL
jgi:hypothetical protein